MCLALLLSAAALSSVSEAATDQWKYAGANEKGERFFYDSASVVYFSKDLIRVWIRELKADGQVKRFEEINCSFKIIRDIQVIDEGKKKIAVRPSRMPSDWRAMEKDPVTKELHKVLCR